MGSKATFAMSIAALGTASCVAIDNAGGSADDKRPMAAAALIRSDGVRAGGARLIPAGAAMILRVDAQGLPPGVHGMHIHATGRCDPPDFSSAQGHWNPSGRAHGSANPAGPHAGDLPNLLVGAAGTGVAEFRLPPSAGPLFDHDGAAVVIHAAADDLRTDPSGNSGARIACGVLMRGQGA